MIGLHNLEVIELGYNAFIWASEIRLESRMKEKLNSRLEES